MMRVIFMGTADFAVPALNKLISHPGFEVLGLITQPDKPVGRKQIITAPATKLVAIEHGLPCWQPEKISTDEALIIELKSLKPDLLITAAYGQILKQNILDLAPRGVINLHASILPQYRGPAPINWMIIHGESEVGVSTMQTDAGVDTGDILLTASTKLTENETALELGERLALLGADLLIETLEKLDTITPSKQDPSSVAAEKLIAPFMDRKLGEIDFSAEHLMLGSASPRQADFKVTLPNTAQNIHNLVRGTQAWPGACFYHPPSRQGETPSNHKGKKIAIVETRVVEAPLRSAPNITPGTIEACKEDDSILISCQNNTLLKILKVKPEGKNAMPALQWLLGLKN